MDLRNPIGPFEFPAEVSIEMLNQWIDEIDAMPDQLRAAVAGLDDAQLDTTYRAYGWTLRQVVHHLADTHLNAYVRMKLALTEDNPTIKPYFEDRWAETPEVEALPVEYSIVLLLSLHYRWTDLMRRLDFSDFKRTFFHPEYNENISLAHIVAKYAWHGKHHLAHITGLRERKGW